MMRAVVVLIAVLACGLAFTAQAQQSTCNGALEILYVSGSNFALTGETIRVRVNLGAGSIQGGTELTNNRVRFELDIENAGAGSLVIGGVSDTLKVAYRGDDTITSVCGGVTWSTGLGNGDTASPNQVVFTPSSPVVIPANTSPGSGACSLEFDVLILERSDDTTPTLIEQVVGYSAGDARCNNGLESTVSQSASITLCQVCDDENACTTEVCDPTDNSCDTTDTVTCDDNNACTTESCDIATGECETTDTVTCDDNNACTTESCNETTGQCETTDTVTCDDNNACTTESCNVTSGQCETTDTVICDDEVCQECAVETGLCVDKDPLPAECVEEEICRTPGFWGTHAGLEKSRSRNVTQAVIDECGGCLEVCGDIIDSTALNDADSAVEAICVNIKGNKKLQLVRQLTAAALNCCASGSDSTCDGISVNDVYDACNAACVSGEVTAEVGTNTISCIEAIDCFNNGGSFDAETGECTFSEINCHTRSFGLCDNGDLCSEFAPCEDESTCKPGPAGSSDACNGARQNACKVVNGGEANCAAGTDAGESCAP